MAGTGVSLTAVARRLPVRLLPRPATVVSIVLLLVGWQLLSLWFPPTELPGLGDLAINLAVVVTGGDRFAPLPHYGATLARVGVGFVVALTLATLWGVGMGLRRGIGEFLAGPLFVLLTVPSVVWAFLGVVWFGLADFLVPVFVIVAIVFPYLTVTLWKGIRAIDGDLVDMGRAVGASPAMLWRHVYLPQLRPYLFGAARVGLAVSWKVALVAEVFGAASGVGVIVKYHFEAFDTGMVIAWALPVMVLIVGADRLVHRLERRLHRWQPDDSAPMEAIA